MGGTGKWDGMGRDGTGEGVLWGLGWAAKDTVYRAIGLDMLGMFCWPVLGGNMCRKFTHTFPKGLKVPAAFGHKY